VSRTKSLDTFCDEMARFDLLSPEEEKRLIAAYRAGDLRARDALVNANLRYVVGAAKKYAHQGTAIEDIVQQGNLGLVRAAETFDPAFGARFLTYAARWVHQSIVVYIERDRGVVRMPQCAEAHAALMAFRRTRPGNPRELADEAGLTEAQAEYYWPAVAHPFSAADPDVIGGPVHDAVAERNERNRLAAEVERTLELLTAQERSVIERRWLTDDPKTLREIGAALGGISRERVRQVERSALGKIRAALIERGYSRMEDLCCPV
jgi:RNA polymerase sigma-32 factor